MQYLNQIFSAAQRLQASRSFLRDLRGLEKTTEGVEFAKAIAEGAALGATPEDVVEQVVKAMAGNEEMALEILGSVQEIAKAHIEQHTRTLANGKTVNVKAYETARSAAMKQTTMAHGATFHAMRTKTPEAHENAASAHEAAAGKHAEAHEVHPMDVPEVGKEHANLKGQHQLAAEYHRTEAATMRHGHGYAVQANKAATASQGAQAAITSHQSMLAHQKAADEHRKAHEFDASKGHDQKAAMHTAHAQAAQAVTRSEGSPHSGSDVRAAHSASTKALLATQAAHKADTPAAHAEAAKAHEEAINQHMEIHGAKEDSEEGHHGQIANTHMALHAYHSAKAKTPEEVAKAEVKAHTRVVGGKVEQVGAYTTAANPSSGKAVAKLASVKPKKAGNTYMRDGTSFGGTTHDYTKVAHAASEYAAKDGSREAHAAAASRHFAAAKAHDDARFNRNESLVADHKMHDEIAAHHRDAGRYHKNMATHGKAQLTPADERAAAPGNYDQKAASAHESKIIKDYQSDKGPEVSKAEGPMTTLGGGTDLATKEGGAALAVEGRPDEKDRKGNKAEGMEYCEACDSAYPEGTKHECPGAEVAKAHVEAHSRKVGGKVVQVQSYDTHHAAAMKASAAAHSATAQAQNPEHHTQAAASHMKAAEGHREAAKYAPEDWQQKGHEDNAKLHEHYAKAHHAKAKAADLKADTGVDTPPHTAQDIKELEHHDDYAGFGYLGHQGRTDATDKALAEAASKAKISKHELAAHVLSKSGRHMMDDHSFLDEKATHAERVAHFQRHLTNPKTDKEYGIKGYAKDLEERAPKKAEAAKEPITVRAATPSQGHKIPAKPQEEEMPDARVEHKGHVSTVEFGKNEGRAVLHPEHLETIQGMKDGDSDSFEDEQGEKWDVARKGEHLHFKARGASGLKGKVRHDEFVPFPKKK